MPAVLEILEKFVLQFVTLFSEMAPFLLLGFLLAGVLHVWVPNHLYVPKISKSNFMSVLWAALFGVPLPICSCGVIPTSIALRREGASRGASVSFLISTPATGVDSILATYSLLGLPFAILRPIAAFATALFGGVLTKIVSRGEDTAAHAKAHPETIDFDDCDTDHHCGCGHCEKEHDDQEGHGHCGCGGHDVLQMTFLQKVAETFRYGLVNMVSTITKASAIAMTTKRNAMKAFS